MPRPPVQPIVFKPAVAAEMLQVSRQQIYNLIASGDLRRIQIGSTRSVRVPAADVYALAGVDAPNDGAA